MKLRRPADFVAADTACIRTGRLVGVWSHSTVRFAAYIVMFAAHVVMFAARLG